MSLYGKKKEKQEKLNGKPSTGRNLQKPCRFNKKHEKELFYTYFEKACNFFYILDDGLFGRGQEYLKFSAMFKNDVNKSYNCRKVESL